MGLRLSVAGARTALRRGIRLLAALAAYCLATGEVLAQNDQSRREYATPGLVVETGARTAACDVLTFTADGNYLLAAGDDKVVRTWKAGGRGLGPSGLPLLRWSSFRETRGNIYALALSPDDGQRYVAVAGSSRYGGGWGVAVLERKTGKVKYALKPGAYDKAASSGSVWSLAFSPSGTQLAFGTHAGDVWLWDFQRPGAAARLLGRHGATRADGRAAAYNFVRLVAFLDEERLVSVAAGGELRRWDVPAGGGQVTSRALPRFKGPPISCAAVSRDRKRLAVGYEGYRVEVRSLPDGRAATNLWLPGGPVAQYPQSLAFDAGGNRLAVGVRLVDTRADFLREVGDRVLIYDLRQEPPRPAAGPRPTYHAEALAFHPRQENLLAVAGGTNHEVTLWDLRGPTRRGEVVGPGRCLWGVALAPDGRYLAFQTERDPEPAGPNRRGRGAWKFFDLRQRRWAAGKPFEPRSPRESAGGWHVRTCDPETPADERRADVWFVQGPGEDAPLLPLPWDARYSLPRCYAFLPEVEGKPVRLAVGHMFGVSIFELDGRQVRRSRLLVGHEGEVMALAVSADGKKLVSAGRDQTVSGWSLEDWRYHPALGAEFFLGRNEKLLVGKVAPGSPSWEAGLSPGDELAFLAVGAEKVVFSRAGNLAPVGGDARAALAALERPEPGKELYFAWRRPGRQQLITQHTEVADRPLWRFFATADREWVLWRWRDYYYASSTNGDFHVGWQRSGELDQTPDFYRAEQFRERFRRPDKVAQALAYWSASPEQVPFTRIEPPRIHLDVAGKRVGGEVLADGDVTATVTAVPRGPLDNQKPVRVLLWVNDYQFRAWQGDDLRRREDGTYRLEVTVPRGRLRAGLNLLTAQCYNHGDLRAESRPEPVRYVGRAAPRRDLYGLFVGVGDYRGSRPRQIDLHSAHDAQALRRAWQAQAGEGKMYRKARLEVLPDRAVTPQAILGRLDALAAQVGPDDLLVLHLAGHGVGLRDLEALKVPAGKLKGLDTFLFCCGDFDLDRPGDTTLGFGEVYRALVKLPCHKLVLLDTCRAGTAHELRAAAPDDPIRALTRDGVGPIILAACEPHEFAQEEDTIDRGRAYGLFAVALRRTLQEKRYFDRADADPRDNTLQAGELVNAVRELVRALVRRFREEGVRGVDEQNPTGFLPDLEKDLDLARH
jgi:WD40 repeat protein